MAILTGSARAALAVAQTAPARATAHVHVSHVVSSWTDNLARGEIGYLAGLDGVLYPSQGKAFPRLAQALSVRVAFLEGVVLKPIASILRDPRQDLDNRTPRWSGSSNNHLNRTSAACARAVSEWNTATSRSASAVAGANQYSDRLPRPNSAFPAPRRGRDRRRRRRCRDGTTTAPCPGARRAARRIA